MNLVAYTRVSTDEQASSGLGIAAQHDLINRSRPSGEPVLSWFEDEGISGKVAPEDRPALSAALRFVRSGAADGLVVAKLDRLSRSMRDFVTLLEQSQHEGWNLVILDLGVDTSTPNGRFLAHVIASVAQLERELIGQRTSAAIQAKKATGWRPEPFTDRYTIENIVNLRRTMTLQQVADHLNATGVSTPRGGRLWRPSSVRSVLASAERV